MRVLDTAPMLARRPVMETVPMLETRGLVVATISVLEIKHVVLVSLEGFDVEEVVMGLWKAGVTLEVHLDYLPPQELPQADFSSLNIMGKEDKQETLWMRVNWRFLYGRGPLHRCHMALLVVGPMPWALAAAVQMMSRAVLGNTDTLLLAPVGGSVNCSLLCPHIPLAVRVAVLEVQQRQPRWASYLPLLSNTKM
ncbi:uncharacterized protein [Cherax quadricarinatus]|uniref:uncharacterized protein n=1 Tax=Cherax quadricarinatus TaxID=27406 RepID=UPI00387EAAE1